MKHVPNALTLLRLVLAPVIAWLFWSAGTLPQGSMTALERLQATADYLTLASVLFLVAAITDLFDGMIARAFNAHSKFGRIIDPIADKMLVGLPLIVIAILLWRSGGSVWPIVAAATGVIVIRDVAMTVIRLTAKDGEGARVSSLAKIKTTIELLVVGSMFLLTTIGAHLSLQAELSHPGFGAELQGVEIIAWIWIALLVITAALSAYTGWQYLRPKPNR